MLVLHRGLQFIFNHDFNALLLFLDIQYAYFIPKIAWNLNKYHSGPFGVMGIWNWQMDAFKPTIWEDFSYQYWSSGTFTMFLSYKVFFPNLKIGKGIFQVSNIAIVVKISEIWYDFLVFWTIQRHMLALHWGLQFDFNHDFNLLLLFLDIQYATLILKTA